MNVVKVFAVIVSSVSLVGCFRPSFQPGEMALPQPTAREMCVDVNKRRTSTESLRVLADATISSGSDRASFRYVILSREPSSFRVDVLPVNGAFTLGLLVAHEGKAVWLNAQEKTYSEGKDEKKLVAEHLGLRGVSRETAVALMTGVVPQLSCPNVRVYNVTGGDRLFVDDTTHVAWRVRGGSTEIVSVQILDARGSAVEVEGDISSPVGGAPRVVTLTVFSPARARVDMSLTRVVFNPSLGEQLFEVQPPHDYARID
jgi:hypothetical protein